VALVGGGSDARLRVHFSMGSENEWLVGLNGQTEVMDTVSEKKTIQNSVFGHRFLNLEKSSLSRPLLGPSRDFAGIAAGNPLDRKMNEIFGDRLKVKARI
jgi:hypothetical protein